MCAEQHIIAQPVNSGSAATVNLWPASFETLVNRLLATLQMLGFSSLEVSNILQSSILKLMVDCEHQKIETCAVNVGGTIMCFRSHPTVKRGERQSMTDHDDTPTGAEKDPSMCCQMYGKAEKAKFIRF